MTCDEKNVIKNDYGINDDITKLNIENCKLVFLKIKENPNKYQSILLIKNSAISVTLNLLNI